MKKTLAILSVSLVSGLTLNAANPSIDEIQPSNVFGFVPVTASSTGLTCVAVPVKGYAEGTAIKIAEILQVTDLAVGDTLYTMNGGAYNEYILQSDKSWKASQVVTVGADGTFVAASGTPAEVATIQPGGAFWLKTETEKISIMGDATTPASVAEVTAGWQLIGNPSMTEPMAIQSIGATAGSILKTATKTYNYVGGIGWVCLKGVVGKPTADNKTTDTLAVGEGALFYKK